jgi:RHS repeat-associated protein
VGKERDDNTGLDYYGARYYASWMCRFVSVDGLKDEYPFYTVYQYAGNKPVIGIDIDGRESSSDIGQQYVIDPIIPSNWVEFSPGVSVNDNPVWNWPDRSSLGEGENVGQQYVIDPIVPSNWKVFSSSPSGHWEVFLSAPSVPNENITFEAVNLPFNVESMSEVSDSSFLGYNEKQDKKNNTVRITQGITSRNDKTYSYEITADYNVKIGKAWGFGFGLGESVDYNNDSSLLPLISGNYSIKNSYTELKTELSIFGQYRKDEFGIKYYKGKIEYTNPNNKSINFSMSFIADFKEGGYNGVGVTYGLPLERSKIEFNYTNFNKGNDSFRSISIGVKFSF